MITCSECLERLYPTDPRVPVGRYHQSYCDYFCDKPDYDREIEARLPGDVPAASEPGPWQKEQWQSVQQLRGMVLHLDKQVKEALAKKKSPDNYEPF